MNFILLLNNRLEISLLAQDGHELAGMLRDAMIVVLSDLYDAGVLK